MVWTSPLTGSLTSSSAVCTVCEAAGCAVPVSEEDAEPYVTSYVLNNSGEEIEQAVLETGRIADDTSITVYNTIQAPVITGIGDADSKVNPFIIVAVVVALSGGAWIAYLIKRRQQSAEQ